jgi:hypothetical protein
MQKLRQTTLEVGPWDSMSEIWYLQVVVGARWGNVSHGDVESSTREHILEPTHSALIKGQASLVMPS